MIGLKQGSGGGGAKVFIDGEQGDIKEVWLESMLIFEQVGTAPFSSTPGPNSAMMNSDLYVWHGNDWTLHKYNGTWTLIRNVPETIQAMCAHDDVLYVLMSDYGSSDIKMYSYNGISWTLLASMTTSSNRGEMKALGDVIYIADDTGNLSVLSYIIGGNAMNDTGTNISFFSGTMRAVGDWIYYLDRTTYQTLKRFDGSSEETVRSLPSPCFCMENDGEEKLWFWNETSLYQGRLPFSTFRNKGDISFYVSDTAQSNGLMYGFAYTGEYEEVGLYKGVQSYDLEEVLQ